MMRIHLLYKTKKIFVSFSARYKSTKYHLSRKLTPKRYWIFLFFQKNSMINLGADFAYQFLC